MEVLPVISSTHFIPSPQGRTPSPSFACDRNGHRFNADVLPSAPSSNVSRPPVAEKKKDKVVFVLGTTGAGKSKLAIDLAAHFAGEVVNSDKMQVYTGLNVITNKVTDEECAGIPHHLIGGVDPDADYTVEDFCREATRAVESILSRGRLPIIAGGSNSYIEELVDGDLGKFRTLFDCFFLWIDVQLPVLHQYVNCRVDKMVEMGLVEEARGVFEQEADYSKGIRRSIGVPEMDQFFRAEGSADVDEETRAVMLKEAIEKIKENTRDLTCRQLEKIRRFSTLQGWELHRIDATKAFEERGNGEAEQVWISLVRKPSIEIVGKFLVRDSGSLSILEKMVDNAKARPEAIAATATPAVADQEQPAPLLRGAGWGRLCTCAGRPVWAQPRTPREHEDQLPALGQMGP